MNLIEQMILKCHLTHKFENPGTEDGMCAGLRTMDGEGEPCEECKECRLYYGYADEHDVKQTNADRIRSMSDEELAKFMANKGGYIACIQCDFFNRDKGKCESPSGWLCTKGYAEVLIHKWLQSEVE